MAPTLGQHLHHYQLLRQQYQYLFDPLVLPEFAGTVDIKAAFLVVKQRLYAGKDIYSQFIVQPQPQFISQSDNISMVAILTELLRIIEANAESFAIHQYRLAVQSLTGQIPLG